MLRLGVAGDLADLGLDSIDAVHGAESDGDRVAGVGGEEGVEAVEVFEVEGQGVQVEGLANGVDVGKVCERGVAFVGFGEGGVEKLHDVGGSGGWRRAECLLDGMRRMKVGFNSS